MTRLTLAALHDDIGITPDTPGYGRSFGPRSRAALMMKLTNTHAPALTEADYQTLAVDWRVPVKHIKGVRKIEAPRGAFDDQGRPAIVYERHVFARNCQPRNAFNMTCPALSGAPFKPGQYGTFGGQWDKLLAACALDPDAAFQACSWGAFQVLGENAIALGYSNAYELAKMLTTSEAAHLDSFRRFVESKGLVDKFRACKPGDASSCIPFVEGYNGKGFRTFGYHTKLAEAIK